MTHPYLYASRLCSKTTRTPHSPSRAILLSVLIFEFLGFGSGPFLFLWRFVPGKPVGRPETRRTARARPAPFLLMMRRYQPSLVIVLSEVLHGPASRGLRPDHLLLIHIVQRVGRATSGRSASLLRFRRPASMGAAAQRVATSVDVRSGTARRPRPQCKAVQRWQICETHREPPMIVPVAASTGAACEYFTVAKVPERHRCAERRGWQLRLVPMLR